MAIERTMHAERAFFDEIWELITAKKPTNDVTSAEVPLFTHLKSVIFSIIKVDEY